MDIIDASIHGDVERVRSLIKENPDNIFKEDSCGQTSLMFASSRGHLDIFKEILKVNPSFINYQEHTTGCTALHDAIAFKQLLVVIELL